jgi:hypothetical protein
MASTACYVMNGDSKSAATMRANTLAICLVFKLSNLTKLEKKKNLLEECWKVQTLRKRTVGAFIRTKNFFQNPGMRYLDICC